MKQNFQQTIKTYLDNFNTQQANKFPNDEIIRIDLHCHDHNSNVPDELIGRILHVPETFLPTNTLINELTKNGCNALTVTNHNNAKSCYQLQKQNVDVLTAAEFTCTVPDFNLNIHVLAYGFDQAQEIQLLALRKNLYHFLQYAHQQHIPTVWAHPLFLPNNAHPPLHFFQKMATVFENFEAINGQRDSLQNVLVIHWLNSLNQKNHRSLC